MSRTLIIDEPETVALLILVAEDMGSVRSLPDTPARRALKKARQIEGYRSGNWHQGKRAWWRITAEGRERYMKLKGLK